jgi:predicted metal-dependent phosphoesterase TrpH
MIARKRGQKDMKYCDLHTHSIYSDGTWTPLQLIEEAQRLGLGAVALCDHNTVAGLPAFLEAAQGREVEAVPGVELSTDYEGTELHIVGLFIRPEHYAAVAEIVAEGQRQKEQSNRDLITALNQAGYALDYGALAAAVPDGRFNRAHVAAEMVRKGYAESMQDAFRRYLRPEIGYYRQPRWITAYEAIGFLKSLGTVAVLAHPFLSMKEARVRAFLPQAVERGLDAMETMYVTYDEPTTRLAMEMADAFGLKHSGGSDFHGDNKPGIYLGEGKGNLKIPISVLQELRQR